MKIEVRGDPEKVSFKHCKNCQDRWIDIETGANCHTTCLYYAEDLADARKARKAEQYEKQVNSYSVEEIVKRANKDAMRRKRRGRK